MRKLTLLGALVLFAPLNSFAFGPTPPVGPGAIEDMLKGMFTALDAGDLKAVQACLVDESCPFPVQVYDLDFNNHSVAIEGLDAAKEYLATLMTTLERDSIKVASKITKIRADCHSPELGYATLEFTQAFTVDGKTEPSYYRATVLVRWGKDQSSGPKIFHWHSSLAKPVADAPPAVIPNGKK